MQPHIEATITDLQKTVTRLNGIITFLSDFGDGLDDGLFPVEHAPKPLAIRVEHAPKPAKPTKSKPQGGPKRTSEEIQADIESLNEPFDSAALMKRTGMSLKAAQGALYRNTASGFLRKVGYGLYKRAAKSPIAAPAAAKPAGRTDLEKKLQDALKQRDHARENGRDSIVEMFQKEIDALEAQLQGKA